jgi:hypothetical protein
MEHRIDGKPQSDMLFVGHRKQGVRLRRPRCLVIGVAQLIITQAANQKTANITPGPDFKRIDN